MKSNFSFLMDEPLTAQYFESAMQAEAIYTQGFYNPVLTLTRTVAENLARDIADQKFVKVGAHSTFSNVLHDLKQKNIIDSYAIDLFYAIKKPGNRAAHELATATLISQEEALDTIKHLYILLVWFVNTFYDEKVDVTAFKEPKLDDFLYSTTVRPPASDRNIIYVQSADTSNGHFAEYVGNLKIGKAQAGDLARDNSDNSPEMREDAEKRIKQYMTTSGLPLNLEWVELAYRKSDDMWFTDTDVHRVLERSGVKHSDILQGQEWFHTDLPTAKAAIKAVKNQQSTIDLKRQGQPRVKIVLRPEQKEAVEKAKKAFKNHNKMLWNAKMRFGKTLSALQLVKDEKFEHVLIMTHRPVVDEGWFEDFKKIGMPEAGYLYGSKKQGATFNELEDSDLPFVYFASLQDLRGSEEAGGKAGDKNRELFDTHWDLVIIDEAHEGTQTELAQNVTKLVSSDDTKLLKLSGTPFNILDEYGEDQVYTWDYTQEQQAKLQWGIDHPGEPNPYASLPKVNMFTFEMNKNFDEPQFIGDGTHSFNFKEFFRVNSQGKFVYEDKVKQFLANITSPDSRTNYPFSTKEFRDNLRHTLWIMPGVKEAGAMEALLKKDPVLGEASGYQIVNVVKNVAGDDTGITSESDVDRVNEAIGDDPAATKTITLTVRKLTTGVTVKPWTGVVFLSNTNSAMQYLQAAFRAQTPYSSPTFGKKTNCYIFDFAPDRALTVMAESTQLRTGVGKRTSSAQKDQMKELMNFLPIIGMNGNGMKRYSVDTMLAQIKRVYAEKAVRTGFDDDSLYSDELLMLKDVDLKEFNDLKAIVGTTPSEKKPVKVDINHQGLTDEEYNDALNGKEKKRKKDRTPEEEAAIEKMKELKKQRKTMISILRSISIRIPMMIYGMDIKLSDDVNINKFIENVDDESWKEFMPKGVTKELFRKFSKYYDQDVFIEAGRIIRRKVKDLDKLDPIERAEKLAEIFGTFRNPDKETVLTPWRVVNMHLGKTIGGLSFFDDSYQYTTKDGVSANHWIQTEYTDQVFKDDTHILEINSKTGLYPLYAGMTLYWQAFQKLNEKTAGKFGLDDQLFIWQRILRENLFLIAKTPMAKTIAQRTLAGYQDFDMNVEYVPNIVKDAKEDVSAEAKKIKGVFGGMKFDVVIGNPPYQESTNNTSDNSIYNLFMDLSFELSGLVTLITPARFLFNAGKTPKAWNKKMLEDPHLKVVKYYKTSDLVFPRTDIKGGVVITLRDDKKRFGEIGLFTPYEEIDHIIKKVRLISDIYLSSIGFGQNSFKFTDVLYEKNPDLLGVQSKGHKYDLKSNVLEKMNKVFQPNKMPGKEQVIIIGRLNNERISMAIEKEFITNDTNLNGFKLVLPKANGTGKLGEKISEPFIAGPGVGLTETFISFGNFKTKDEANNLLKYVKTKFVRLMLGTIKITQDNTVAKWRMVPLQEFTSNSDIDWSKSIPDIDQQLYRKYGLSQDEINFVETKVQAMQ